MTDLEIEKLKGTMLHTVSKALNEIGRLRGQIDVRDSVISKLSGTVAHMRPLLVRAADALEVWTGPTDSLTANMLIKELREASQK